MCDPRWIFATLLLSLSSSAAVAATEAADKPFGGSEASASWGAGFRVMAISSDWGVGAVLTSPELGQSGYHLSVSASAMSSALLPSPLGEYDIVALGISNRQAVSQWARGYSNIELGALLPNSSLSSKVAMIAMPEVGLEFFPAKNEGGDRIKGIALFAELGASIPIFNVHADAVSGAPYYARGVAVSIGTRYFF